MVDRKVLEMNKKINIKLLTLIPPQPKSVRKSTGDLVSAVAGKRNRKSNVSISISFIEVKI